MTGQIVMDGSGPALNARKNAILIQAKSGQIHEFPLEDFGYHPPRWVENGAGAPKTVYSTQIPGMDGGGTIVQDKPGYRPQPKRRKATQAAFKDAPGRDSGRDFFVVEIDGKNVTMSLSDRAGAVEAGKIFENYDIADLPRGRHYTWLILDDGTKVFGEVTDGFEFGVKHGHLANGRKVVAAGEMMVAENGNVVFNLQSGTFSKPIARFHPDGPKAGQAEMRARTMKAFEADLEGTSATVKSVDDGLLPKAAPADLKRAYCWNSRFLLLNEHWCD